MSEPMIPGLEDIAGVGDSTPGMSVPGQDGAPTWEELLSGYGGSPNPPSKDEDISKWKGKGYTFSKNGSVWNKSGSTQVGTAGLTYDFEVETDSVIECLFVEEVRGAVI